MSAKINTTTMSAKINYQVCTIPQGEKLAGLGIQEPAFVWVQHSDRDAYVEQALNVTRGWGMKEGQRLNHAFTVAELGMMLPDLITKERQYELVCVKEEDCWLIMYVAGNDLKNVLYSKAETTEAEARSEMLIYLLEQKVISAEDCNKAIAQ